MSLFCALAVKQVLSRPRNKKIGGRRRFNDKLLPGINSYGWSLRMHVLSKPIERHLAAETFGFCRGIYRGAYGCKLRPKTDIVDEASDLAIAVPASDPATEEIRQGRQRLPIDSSTSRMVPQLEIFPLGSPGASSAEVLLFSVS